MVGKELEMGLRWPGGDSIGIVRCGCLVLAILLPGEGIRPGGGDGEGEDHQPHDNREIRRE